MEYIRIQIQLIARIGFWAPMRALWVIIAPNLAFGDGASDLIVMDHAPSLHQGPDDPLVVWSESRVSPRRLQIYFVRLDLESDDYRLEIIPSRDPDGAGIYEGTLELPEVLMERSEAWIAVNASAFRNPTNPADYDWHEGKSVDINGLIVSESRIISPADTARSSFWVDASGVPHIGAPDSVEQVQLSVADWNNLSPQASGQLLKDGAISIQKGGQPHPRTAIGFDESRRFVILAVVDGRQEGYSEGCTLYELAEIMKASGCSDAINLDGGGSSILIARAPTIQVINRPSGGSSRPIPVMIGITKNSGN